MTRQRPFANQLLWLAVLTLLTAFCLLPSARGQSATATLSGTVEDEQGAVIPGAAITVLNPSTALQRQATTNDEGSFTITLLQPGTYSVTVRRDGFAPIEVKNVVLNVGDQKALRIQLKAGDVKAEVQVLNEAALVSESSAVGTVVDRQFVENIPLNGRSFQSLLELTPGVILAPVTDSTGGNGGQFSVNGQRTSANYFMVDGVSANVGIGSGVGSFAGQSGSGQLPALTAQGGTNALVSVDALQEFRIRTSTYAPEFGRVPGGQVSLVTRSGTNQFHGSVFEYFRDEVLDAKDWFVNANRLAKPQLRQHQFGGTFSGPVMLPLFGEGSKSYWSGRNKTFFFFSYEGLRLLSPRAQVVNVPTLETRRTAAPAVQSYVNAFPVPNGRDIGGGFAQFAASYSDQSQFNATALRLDHSAGEKLTFFGRVSHTPSYSRVRADALSSTQTTNQQNTSITVGSTWLPSNRVVHDLRVNYTTNYAPFIVQPDSFGGATPPPPSVFPAGSPDLGSLTVVIVGSGFPIFRWGLGTDWEQRQFNIVDSVTLTGESHEWKFGADFRRTHPLFWKGGEGRDESLVFFADRLPSGTAANYLHAIQDPNRRSTAFDQLSLYAQDNWKLSQRLTLTYGLRWELVPPPHATEGPEAVTVENIDNPFGGQVHLAPRDTPLWRTRYNNFAPRIGASYAVSRTPGAELVVRGGFGVFHDLGYGNAADAYRVYPFFAPKVQSNVTFPLPASALVPPRLVVDPPNSILFLDRNLVLPRTYQWNVSVERSLGPSQTLTASYVGAAGRKLLKKDIYNIRLLEWPTLTIPVTLSRNRGYSDYEALQLQFQRRLSRGLQALASSTFGRSRDTASQDFGNTILSDRLPPERDYGYSDYDVRHNFTAAMTYEVPELRGTSLWWVVARDWGVDMIFRARSGFPINVLTRIAFPAQELFPAQSFSVRPNVVAGQPFWLDDSSAPGGRRLNRQAFTVPPASTQGDLPRGVVRGFGARQIDLALKRDFGLREQVRVQLRFELFNVTNTPNFSDPEATLSSSPLFGQSTQMLNRGLGGLSALYQIGGPRSAQISAKLLF